LENNDQISYSDFIWHSERTDALKVRNEIEEWLSRIEDESARKGIETYLKRKDNHQVRGAYFELYLHECLVNNKFTIEFHPSTKSIKPPDFITYFDETPQFYMEATVHKPESLNEDLFPKSSNPLEALLLETNESVTRKLRKKGSRYNLDNLPFILAINVLEGFFGLDEAEDQLASMWSATSFTKVSAVLVVGKLDPLVRFSEKIELYHNPHAQISLNSYKTAESILGKNSPRKTFSKIDWAAVVQAFDKEV
jgi:hypothetical protein